jgi:hypothetical protein
MKMAAIIVVSDVELRYRAWASDSALIGRGFMFLCDQPSAGAEMNWKSWISGVWYVLLREVYS